MGGPRAFETQTTGKWILTGEHSVLRGTPALVFPLKSRSLYFHFHPVPGKGGLELHSQGQHSQEAESAFWACFEKACDIFSVDPDFIEGDITLESNIPAGAGLGASASLCVALARWFSDLNGSSAQELTHRARELENVFHGESSGVDVAVVAESKPIRFLRKGPIETLSTTWEPQLFLSYSGSKGATKNCVEAVQGLGRDNPDLLRSLDQRMEESCRLALESLTQSESGQTDQRERFVKLGKAMDLAQSCFSEWGLTNPQVEDHMEKLRKCGASSIKLTGSGQGGFCLSLWEKDPPEELLPVLIPCFGETK